MGADPVLDKSGFLCMYMSNHPDTLVSYVRYWGKVSAQVSSAKMTSIDTKGMDLTYEVKGSSEPKKVRVVFDPPLAGYEEVKPRLMGMKSEAEEQLGMVRAPQVTKFGFDTPSLLATLGMMSLLVYCTAADALAPSYSEYTPYFAFGKSVLSYLPSWTLVASWGVLVVAHSLEALYVLNLCRRHRAGVVLGAKFTLGTLFFGFPFTVGMRREIQSARIDSILKGQ